LALIFWHSGESSMADSVLVQKLNTFFGEKVILFKILLIVSDNIKEVEEFCESAVEVNTLLLV